MPVMRANLPLLTRIPCSYKYILQTVLRLFPHKRDPGAKRELRPNESLSGWVSSHIAALRKEVGIGTKENAGNEELTKMLCKGGENERE